MGTSQDIGIMIQLLSYPMELHAYLAHLPSTDSIIRIFRFIRESKTGYTIYNICYKFGKLKINFYFRYMSRQNTNVSIEKGVCKRMVDEHDFTHNSISCLIGRILKIINVVRELFSLKLN